MKIRLSLLVVTIVASGFAGTLRAQSPSGYPSKPIRVVVPFPPGGGADSIARLLGPRIHERLGQPLIVDNRSGAGTIIGGELVAKAPPDGHTLFMATFINAVNPSLRTKMPWDITKDFSPVSLLATVSYTLVIHPSLPARSVKELVALARSRPGQLDFASAGNGTPGHLAGELLNSIAKLDMVHVPYKGAAPVLIDVLAGQVPITFGNNIATLPHIKSSRLRALAVTSAKRSQLLPGVPTMIEGGLNDFLVVGWYGLLVPSGTPQPVIAKLSFELATIVREPDVQNHFASGGSEAAGSSPAELASFIRSEIAKWTKIVKSAGIRAD